MLEKKSRKIGNHPEMALADRLELLPAGRLKKITVLRSFLIGFWLFTNLSMNATS